MTVTLERVAPWRTRPGWGISVDLTPPEVVTERHLARLRRLLGIGLVALLLVVVGGYVLAARQHGAAATALEREQTTTTQVRARAADFRDISSMQSTLTQLRTQIATLMSSDVDLDALSKRLSTSLPTGMTITSQAVSISLAGTAAATGDVAVPEADPADPADPALPTTIGTISLTGTGRTLDDLATYVERLQAIPGVTDVVPTSNAASETGVDYTVTMNMTTDLLSHQFDVAGVTP